MKTICPCLTLGHKVVVFMVLASSLLSVSSCATGASSTEILRSTWTVAELEGQCNLAIKDMEDALNHLAAQPLEGKANLMALEDITTQFSEKVSPVVFMNSVHQDANIRKASSACEEKIGQVMAEIFTRRDLYNLIKDIDQKTLNAGEQRLLFETKRAFENNGLKLQDPKKYQRVRDILKQMAAYQVQFAANLVNDQSKVVLSEADLAGVSADLKAALTKEADGKYSVAAHGPLYIQLMQNVEKAEVRKRLLSANQNRAADKNVALLEKTIKLRQEMAALLGFKSWADYRTNGRMAQNAANVEKFLQDLRQKLQKRNQQDLAKLLAYKKTLDPQAKTVESWDTTYLAYQLKKRDYQIDDEEIRPYFPLDKVLPEMLSIYGHLFGVDFKLRPDIKVWHPDVLAFEVLDKDTGNLRAYFFADLFPRDGKYDHFAAFPLLSGFKEKDGSYHKPVAAVVANFNAPTPEKPSLLNHDELETLFHEFGHIMHQILTKAPYASLSGTSVEQDFVESVSQMMEHWVWQPEVLERISQDWRQKEASPLPQVLIDRLLAAKDFNQGSFYTRQLWLAIMDLTYHTQKGAVDTTKISNDLYRQIITLQPLANGHFQGTFGHLMGGYDAGYYGYLWSKVYADDMFTRFAPDVFSAKVGREFCKNILEQGNMQDNGVLLRNFLQREPSPNAFLKNLGL